ncbi:MAG: cobalamin-binding protein [Phycisphaerae bacterium]|nr:cobalamin-binding protein [Phycisphaerae bacterium]|tara:strand:+ start:129 stop:1043 length:915 start_codon:yes stop_codon:yes gene_type:complete
MRVVSLVPSATELLCTAGGEDLLVGRSHECDWPATIMNRPILTAPRINASAPADIDSEVSTAREDGQSLYELDVELLSSLQPDVIITQDLCGVCSIDLDSVREVARTLPGDPQILSLNPRCMEDVFDDLLRIGKVCAIEEHSRESLAALRERWWNAQDFVNAYLDGPQVAVIEWTDPLYVAGHWTPDIVVAAGGEHAINGSGEVSRRISPEDLLEHLPERVVICPCGRTLEEAAQDAAQLQKESWWSLLPAVQDNQVMLVDGNAMFSRPGTRLVDAMEWMTSWLQDRPDLRPRNFPAVRLDAAD